jgi:hypothetical protein
MVALALAHAVAEKFGSNSVPETYRRVPFCLNSLVVA